MIPKNKKNILLYAAEEHVRSVYAYVLGVRSFRILGGISSEAPVPDVVLILDDHSIATARAACSIAHRLPDVPMLVLTGPHPKGAAEGYPPHAELLPAKAEMVWILERLRVLASRKRGPRPQQLQAVA